MVIIVLICMILFLFAGLAIDSSILATSKAQQRHSAEYISLAALKAYMSDPSNDFGDKLDSAILRAREIAGSNLMLAQPFQKTKTQGNLLGSNTRAFSTDNGTITPGIWHFNPGTTACAGTICPCNAAQEWATPCFEKIDPRNNSKMAKLNSFQVTFKTDNDSPIRALFTQFVGTKEQSLQSTATTAIVPKHVVFLMDISRSSQWETHLPLEMTRGASPTPEVFSIRDQILGLGGINAFEASESSFQISKVNPYLGRRTSCNTGNHTNICGHDSTPPYAEQCNFDGLPYDYPSNDPDWATTRLFDTIYNIRNAKKSTFSAAPILERLIPLNPREERPTKHYANVDYECFIVEPHTDVLPDGTTTPTTNAQSFLVDTRNNISTLATYQGPEPLSTMMNGVNHGLTILEERRIPGDRAGFIAFDKSARIDIRRTPTLLSPQDPIIQNLISATDTSDTSVVNLERRYSNFFLMPRASVGLNIPEALAEAKELLIPTRSDTIPSTELPSFAERIVVMMSDGLSSCIATGTPLTRFCGNRLEDIDASLTSASNILINDYASNDIQFNFIMMGDHALPHTLIRLDKSSAGTSKCMSEADTRIQETPLSLTDSYNYSSGTAEDALSDFKRGANFFLAGNRLSEGVRATNGNWFPIRPCFTGGGTTCQSIKESLDAECNSKATSLGHGDIINDSIYGDDQGRLGFDLTGRDKRQQVEDAIDVVFNSSSYILVD
jgi:hypothetical protein